MSDRIDQRLATIEQRLCELERHVFRNERLYPRPGKDGERVTAVIQRVAEQLPPPPVDRTQVELTNGAPVPQDRGHAAIEPNTGMQRSYVVLTAEERAKGFVRPVRRAYKHATCGAVTTMGLSLAETYARDPGFYSGTFCATCRSHFPLDQFTWDGTNEQVGS